MLLLDKMVLLGFPIRAWPRLCCITQKSHRRFVINGLETSAADIRSVGTEAMSKGIDFDQPVSQVAIRRRRFQLPYFAVEPLIVVIDVSLIIAASVLAAWGYHIYVYGSVSNINFFAGLGVIAAILHVFVAKSFGLYRLQTMVDLDRQWRRLACGWLLVMLLLMLILFLLQLGTVFSRGSTISFAYVALAFLLAGRAVVAGSLRNALESGALSGRRAVMLGDSDELGALNRLELLRWFGVEEIGRISLPKLSEDHLAFEKHDLAAVDRAMELARQTAANEIVLALRWDDIRRLQFVRDRLRDTPLPVRLLPDRTVGTLLKQPVITVGPSLSFEIQRGPLTVMEQALKRQLDLIVASAAIVVLSPLLLLISLIIKLDSSGPILFRQHRNGFNGQPFVIFKFRTMNVLENGPVIEQAKKVDPRVTRVGRWLRKTSIDELPQLFNVVLGDMSLIGPRPHARAHDDQYSRLIATYAFRHHVKPGITGWAQINGCRGETARLEQMQQRVELDLWYINNWNPFLDIRILVWTCFAVFRSQEAAY